MTITEQDRADAMESIRDLIPKYTAELAVIDALEQHWPMWDGSLNLGYYRTFVECSCGTGIWYGEHRGDPTWADRWALHRAMVVREAISTSTTAREGHD
jgi:hypothetical protein